MTAMLYPWQSDAWQQLQQLRTRLPHAVLLHGPRGIGKTALAEHFAQALLCSAPLPDGQACGACDSCGWFGQYGHPDYRRVRPENLEEQEAGEAAELGEGGDGKKAGKASKTPSKEIKIDQIRALADFMNISTHRQGLRIVTLYPAEALNIMAANALLKTLEEPPPGTLFLLVSNGVERLLPTILSRCRKFALGMPSREAGLAWLQQQQVKDADRWLAQAGGAPLGAFQVAQGDAGEILSELLPHLVQPGVDHALKAAERLQKVPVPEVVASLQCWLYDVCALKLAGRTRYFPRHEKELAVLAARADLARLLAGVKSLGERRAVAEHPLSARLFIEDMLLDYSGLFSSQTSRNPNG